MLVFHRRLKQRFAFGVGESIGGIATQQLVDLLAAHSLFSQLPPIRFSNSARHRASHVYTVLMLRTPSMDCISGKLRPSSFKRISSRQRSPNPANAVFSRSILSAFS